MACVIYISSLKVPEFMVIPSLWLSSLSHSFTFSSYCWLPFLSSLFSHADFFLDLSHSFVTRLHLFWVSRILVLYIFYIIFKDSTFNLHFFLLLYKFSHFIMVPLLEIKYNHNDFFVIIYFFFAPARIYWMCVHYDYW